MIIGESDAYSELASEAALPSRRKDKHHLNQALLALTGKHTDLLPGEQYRCRIPVVEGRVYTAVAETGAIAVAGQDRSGRSQLYLAMRDSTRFMPVLKQHVGQIRAICFPQGSDVPACVAAEGPGTWRLIWDEMDDRKVWEVPLHDWHQNYLKSGPDQRCWLTCWTHNALKRAFITTSGAALMLREMPGGEPERIFYHDSGARLFGIFDGIPFIVRSPSLSNQHPYYGSFKPPKTRNPDPLYVNEHADGGIIAVGIASNDHTWYIARSHDETVTKVKGVDLFLVDGDVFCNKRQHPYTTQDVIVTALDGSWTAAAPIHNNAIKGRRYSNGSVAIISAYHGVDLFDKDGAWLGHRTCADARFTPDGRVLFRTGWAYPQTLMGLDDKAMHHPSISPHVTSERGLHQKTVLNWGALQSVASLGNGQLAVHRYLPMDPDANPDADPTVE